MSNKITIADFIALQNGIADRLAICIGWDKPEELFKDDAEKRAKIAQLQEEQNRIVPLTNFALPQMLRVRFTEESDISGYKKKYPGLWKTNPLVLLGEIAQAPGHVVVLDLQVGTCMWMIHTSDLEAIPMEDC